MQFLRSVCYNSFQIPLCSIRFFTNRAKSVILFYSEVFFSQPSFSEFLIFELYKKLLYDFFWFLIYFSTCSRVLSLTVATKYDGFHRCPPQSDCLISGCLRNSHLAVFPFKILIASDRRSCGLQSIWYCNEYTYHLPCVTSFNIVIYDVLFIFTLYHTYLNCTSKAT